VTTEHRYAIVASWGDNAEACTREAASAAKQQLAADRFESLRDGDATYYAIKGMSDLLDAISIIDTGRECHS
jgi:hypothetical protein